MLFHPILVHFPIALYFFETILVLFWVLKKDDAYRRFALLTFQTAFISMFIAAATGLYDAGGLATVWQHLKVRIHFLAAVSVVIWYSLRFLFWRSKWKGQAKVHILQVVIGNLLIALAGFLGGELVY